jgi:hypothetical protein
MDHVRQGTDGPTSPSLLAALNSKSTASPDLVGLASTENLIHHGQSLEFPERLMIPKSRHIATSGKTSVTITILHYT